MEIIVSKSADKDLEKLGKKTSIKIIKKIYQLELNPFSGKKLAGELSGKRSERVWPYRIIYKIENGQIQILSVLHRQGAYK